ncbi:hypothetical protein J6590_065334 [Homalodisca vitripennis]|nr:hypothetical protein J6590_065334 [Homalodisca vitripennis]
MLYLDLGTGDTYFLPCIPFVLSDYFSQSKRLQCSIMEWIQRLTIIGYNLFTLAVSSPDGRINLVYIFILYQILNELAEYSAIDDVDSGVCFPLANKILDYKGITRQGYHVIGDGSARVADFGVIPECESCVPDTSVTKSLFIVSCVSLKVKTEDMHLKTKDELVGRISELISRQAGLEDKIQELKTLEEAKVELIRHRVVNVQALAKTNVFKCDSSI